MPILELVLFGLGICSVIVGADILVRAAAWLAFQIGISPLVVGLTVVAFGTGAPELAVSVKAGMLGNPDIALGNVVGSNIANILLVLGAGALVAPVAVSQQLIRKDAPLMATGSLLLLALAWNGSLSRTDGSIMFACFIAYTVWAISAGRKEWVHTPPVDDGSAPLPNRAGPMEWLWSMLRIVLGLLLLFAGSQWMVTGAVCIAGLLGMSHLIISLTVVAASTSVPEVATTVVAGVRGQTDIALGNVVGSNIFNILSVLGIAGITSSAPLSVPVEALAVDMPVMIATALLCLPIAFTGMAIDRWEGALFLCYYGAYITYLVLKAMNHPFLQYYVIAMVGVVVPVTVILILLHVIHDWRKTRAMPS